MGMLIVIHFIEFPAGYDDSSKVLEKSRRYGALISQQCPLLLLHSWVFRPVRTDPLREIIERQMRRQTYGLDAGNRGQIFFQLSKETDASLVIGIAGSRQCHLERHGAAWNKPGIYLQQLYKRPDHQSGSNQKY